MRKRITTQAKEPVPLILFDNVGKGQELGGPALCAALTSPDRVWSDRLLGQNAAFRGKMTWAWYATGNNCTVGADMHRRICRSRLVPKTNAPELRTGFRYDPIEEWVENNKHAYMWACLSLLKGYILDGMPSPSGQPWGSYSAWYKLIVGCVEWAGFGTVDDSRIMVEDDEDTAELIEGFVGLLKSGPMSSREIYDACGFGAAFAVQVPENAKPLKRIVDGLFPRGITTRELGTLMRGLADVYQGGLCIRTNGKTHGNVAKWIVSA
jgi:hypothetical protein